MSRIWAMYDPDPRGVFPVANGREAERLNRERNGIFRTLNRFDGPRRMDNLVAIEAWSVDLDDGTKEEQLERIKASPLVPSSVVETRNGYHVHFAAKEGTADGWPRVMEERLIPFFGADRNAKDIARILRVPGFFWWKDPENPFPVRRVHRWDVAYTEQQMLEAFPVDPAIVEAKERAEADARRIRSEVRFSGDSSGDSFWRRVIELDCLDALQALSGHWLVNGEQYTFRRTRSGTHNIRVNGKGSSCWVDASGRIGSKTNGGPSIVRWCAWLGHSYRDIARGLKEVFSGLEDGNGRG